MVAKRHMTNPVCAHSPRRSRCRPVFSSSSMVRVGRSLKPAALACQTGTGVSFTACAYGLVRLFYGRDGCGVVAPPDGILFYENFPPDDTSQW